MLGAGYMAYGIGSAISGLAGTRSSANYFKIIKKLVSAIPVAGREIREITRVAGSEARETIETAGDVANRIFDKMGNEVRQSSSHARDCLLDIARLVGDESRETAEFGADQALRILTDANNKSHVLLDALRFQMCEAIKCAGKEAKTTGLALESNLNNSITKAREETEEVIEEVSERVNALISIANSKLRGTAANCHKIAKDCIEDLKDAIKESIKSLNRKLKGRISQLKEVGDAFIIGLGAEGRLLINEAGLVANQSLDKCELLIGEAGKELRLSIDRADQKLQARLWELPLITAKLTRLAGYNFIDGMIDRLKTTTFARKYQGAVINQLEVGDLDIMEIVRDIPRHELSPKDKYEVYKTIIEFIQSQLKWPWAQRANVLFQIGLQILKANLQESDGWIYDGNNYAAILISEMSEGEGTTESEFLSLETFNPKYVLGKMLDGNLQDPNPPQQIVKTEDKIQKSQDEKLEAKSQEIKKLKKQYLKLLEESVKFQSAHRQQTAEIERLSTENAAILPLKQNVQRLEEENARLRQEQEELQRRCEDLVKENNVLENENTSLLAVQGRIEDRKKTVTQQRRNSSQTSPN